MDQIKEKYQKEIDEVGDCMLSCMNATEVIESHDAMGIGLSIKRPEAAIADPTRLEILDIYPTYLSVDSFLESAKFKLMNSQGQAQNVHGGFSGKGHEDNTNNKGAQLAMGVGRENLTGLLPLYLFKDHWAIARRRMQPILGFMCCLDILGYQGEQYFTVPFSVLATALFKVKKEPNDVNKRMLAQIELTC